MKKFITSPIGIVVIVVIAILIIGYFAGWFNKTMAYGGITSMTAIKVGGSTGQTFPCRTGDGRQGTKTGVNGICIPNTTA